MQIRTSVSVSLEKNTAKVTGIDEPVNIGRLPESFMKWQMDARTLAFKKLEGREAISMMSAHLPTVVTYSKKSGICTATKGTGLIPAEKHLHEITKAMRECLKEIAGKAWDDPRVVEARTGAMKLLYEHPERIDRRMLGGIEIFMGQTYKNILERPFATLHYTGAGPGYCSYQVNCVVKVIGEGDKEFDFLYNARQLFEKDMFHISQKSYPLGYLFFVEKVFDKFPGKNAGKQIA